MTALACLVLVWAPALGEARADRIPPPDYAGSCTDAGCHTGLVQRAVKHDPAAGGTCDVCHEATNKEAHRFKLTAEGAELCFGCHDAPAGKNKHDPVAQGSCTVCHDPHGSANRHLLPRPTVAEVCGDCHEEITKDLRYLHGPVAAGDCTACHHPHAADQPALLLGPSRALCLKCHRSIEDSLKDQTHRHAPVEEDCTGCHHPHGSSDKMMLKASSAELCLSCHAEVKKLLAENPDRHGPVADGNCTGCHREMHGGTHFRLLDADYPAGFYVAYEEKRYALCFECHEADAFRQEKTDTGTEFRNGEQNLHYLHVHRKVKGRTCRACHQVHASKQPKHVSDAAAFGEWKIPIQFEQTKSGGSCLTGCHRRYRYDRESAVVNVPVGPAKAPEPAAGRESP